MALGQSAPASSAVIKLIVLIHPWMRMTATSFFVEQATRSIEQIVGMSQAAKAASHDRILDIAAAQIHRDGIDSLTVAQLMKEAELTHGGFYRRVAEAAQRALSQGSTWTMATGQLGRRRGFTKLVDGYLSAWHRDHPESGCGVAGIAADVARADDSARATYTHRVQDASPCWLT